MATFQKFGEIQAWQKARELTRAIYATTSEGAFAKDYGLCDQIRRAAVSILSNIAEGFERGGTREFLQFLAAAKGSTGEVKAQMFVALDQNYITSGTFQHLVQLTDETGRLIGGLMGYLRSTTVKGVKFK